MSELEDFLRFTPEEAARHADASQPGWVPPAAERQPRPLTEAVIRTAKIVNLLHSRGKKIVTASEVADELVRLGWKPFGSSNNGVGDALGKGGLCLPKIPMPGGGNGYKTPPDGVTTEYLQSKNFDC